MSSTRPRLLAIILTAIFVLLAESAFATHFRYGYISWERDLTYTNPANPNEVKIRVTVEGGGRWTYTSWTQATAPTGFTPATRCTTSAAVCCTGVPSIPGDATSLSCPNVGSLFQFVGGTSSGGVNFDSPQSGQYVKVVGKHGITLVPAQQQSFATIPLTPYNIATNPVSTAVLLVDTVATQVVPTEDTVYGRFVFDILMDKTKVLNLTWANSNRISTLLDSNNDLPWQLKATIDLTGSNGDVVTKSPKSQVPAVIPVFTGRINTVQLPSATFDNLIPRWSVSTTTDSQLINPTPVITGGASWNLNPNTGVVSFQPRALGYYAVQFRLAGIDPVTGVERVNVPIDVMFQGVAPSSTTVALSSPQVDYTTSVNSPFSYTVTSTMTLGQPGYRININNTPLPAGAFLSGTGQCTATGTTSTCTQTFNWTPTVNSSASNVCYTSTIFNGPTLVTSAPSYCVNVDLNPLATTMQAFATSGVAGGGPITLSAKLTRTVDNAPLPSRVVKFTFDGSPNDPPWLSTGAGSNGVDTAVTDVNGLATLTVPVVRALPTGQTYTATFNAIAGELLQSSASSGAIAIKAATTLMNVPTLTPTPTIGYPLVASALLNRIYTDGGTLAIGADVDFTLSGGGPTSTLTAPTMATGIASVTFDPSALPTPGPYTVQASFAGNANLFPNADGSPTTAVTAPFMLKQRTQITVPSQTATVGVPTQVNVTLGALPSNAPLGGRAVQLSGAFTGSPMSAVTGPNGTAAFTVTFPAQGNIVVTATYTPTSTETNRNAGSGVETGTASIVVSLAATQLALISPPSVATVSQPMPVTAQLTRTDTTGSVSGVTVTFSLKLNGVLNQTRAGATDANGNVTVSFTPSTVGPYTVQATSPATATLNAASSTVASITVVNQQATVLSAAPVTSFSGQTTTFSATLTANGSPVAGQTVSFAVVGGASLGSALTNAAGVASITANAGSVFTGQFRADYAGGGSYLASTASAGYTVAAAPTAIAVSPVTTISGQATSFSATLTAAGSPLAGQTISFLIVGGGSLGSAVTNAAGVATISAVPPSTLNGQYQADFAAGGNYAASTASAAYTVTAATTTLSLVSVPSTGSVGQPLTVSSSLARVSAPAGAVQGAAVVFTLTAPGGSTQQLSASTAADGVATVAFPALTTRGTYSVSASFAGNNALAASTSGTGNVTVTQGLQLSVATPGGVAGASIQFTATVTTLPDNSPVSDPLVVTFTAGSQSAQSTVSNGTATASITFTSAGPQAVTASIAAGGGYTAATSSPASFTVNPAATAFGALNVNATNFVGDTATVTTTLTRTSAPAGPLAGADVSFSVTGPGGVQQVFTATTDSVGLAQISVPLSARGAYQVTASYGGSSSVIPTSRSASFSVFQKTAVIVNAAHGVATDPTAVTAMLVALPGNAPLAGQTLNFDFNGVASSGAATADAGGIASVSRVFAIPGAYATTVAFQNLADFFVDENGNQLATTGTGTVTVSSVTTALSAMTVPASSLVGDDITVTTVLSRLTAPAGSLAGRVITFAINGAQIQTVTTDAGGVASAIFHIGARGSYTVSASYDGTAAEVAASTSATSSARQKAQLTVTQAAAATAGVPTDVTATLIATPGGALANQAISFSAPGAVPASALATTDANGVAHVTLTFTSGGAFPVTASFDAESDNFVNHNGVVAPETATTSAVVNKATAQLSAISTPAHAVVGQAVTLAATLSRVTAPAGPTAGAVSFTITQPDGSTQIVASTAGSDGIAAASFTPGMRGVFSVTASFDGDASLNSATSSAASVTAYQRTSLAAAPVTGASHAPITVSATLTQLPGNAPLAGQPVAFSFSDGSWATASTDAAGVAQVTQSFATVGDVNVTLTFTNAAGFYADSTGAFPVVATTGTGTVHVTNNAPAFTAPANITAEATGANGAVAAFTATGSDIEDGSIAAVCAPASGSVFPIGSTTVSCTVTDSLQAEASGTFSVTVQDTTAPTLTLPTVAPAAATSAAGRTVFYTATATDIVDVSPTLVCAPVSGSTFAIGSTTVTCVATDAHDNSSTGSFSVSVTNNAPTFAAPANISLPATSSAGRAVTFAALGSDIEDGTLHADCEAQSGNTFPIGTTSVSCTVTDVAGATATDAFTITITNNAPTFAAPANISLPATSSAGRAVTFAALGSDLEDGTLHADCESRSGTTFPIGTTTVACTVTDVAGATATGSFTITITNNAPTFTAPANISLPATSAQGRQVTFTATGSDLEDGTLHADCESRSGTTFPLGTTTVACAVTDVAGATATGSFTITITNNAPTFTAPANLTVEATGATGRAVTFAAPGADVEDGALQAVCTPASGAIFAIATTTVSCTVTDSAHLTASGTFTVTVRDTTGPAITLPTVAPAFATSAAGRVMTYTAPTAVDLVSGTRPVTCSKASGTTFPIGTTTVTCTSTDTRGNTSSAGFPVTVNNNAPTFTPPANIVKSTASTSGTTATFTANGNDVEQGTIAAACAPASGSTFPLGTTTVNCVVTDNRGATAAGSFKVTVNPTGTPTVGPGQTVTFTGGNLPNGATVNGGTLIVAGGTKVGGNVVLNNNGNVTITDSTLNGNLLALDGGAVTVTNSTVAGDVLMLSGSLTTSNATFNNPVNLLGSTQFTLGPGTKITDNVNVTFLTPSTFVNSMCGVTTTGDLNIAFSAAPIRVGMPSLGCAGNSFGSDVQTLLNQAPVEVFGNTIRQTLACTANATITGGSNTARSKSGQCSAF